MVEFNDPKFLGIAGVMYLFCVAVTWKMMFGAWVTLPVKIIMTIVLLPCVFGITYIMLNKG